MSVSSVGQCNICIDTTSEPLYVQNHLFSHEEVEELISGKWETVKLSCDHIFHTSCLHTWICSFKDKTKIANCPNCRQDLVDKPYIQPQMNVGDHLQEMITTFALPFFLNMLSREPASSEQREVYTIIHNGRRVEVNFIIFIVPDDSQRYSY